MNLVALIPETRRITCADEASLRFDSALVALAGVAERLTTNLEAEQATG